MYVPYRKNYGEFGTYCNEDFTTDENSRKVAEPKFAVLSAIWYWSSRSLSAYAEKDDFLQITFRVNGGFNGINDRAKHLKRGYETFQIQGIKRRFTGFCDTIQSNLAKVKPLVDDLIEKDKDLDKVAAAKKLQKDGKITMFERMLFVYKDSKSKIEGFRSMSGYDSKEESLSRKIVRVIIAGLLFSATVQCKEVVNCNNPKGGYEETECARLRNVDADKALDEAYKKLKSRLGKEQAKLLVTAQKGWIQLRDNHCALEVFAIRGTTGYNAEYSECLTKLTELRTKQIESTPADSSMN